MTSDDQTPARPLPSDGSEQDPPTGPTTPVSADQGATPGPGGASAATPERPKTLWPEGTQFGRADKICGSLLAFITAFSLVMLPLRPVILGMEPLALVALTGSRTGMVASGALAATGHGWWPVALVIGTLSLVKFHWIFWWAGKLWGDWFVASLVGPGEKAAKRAKRAEAITRKYDVLAMLLTFIPFVPVPSPIVYAILGTSGTSLRRFLALDVLWALVLQSLYLYLGWRIGEPAVRLLDEFATYSWYLTGAILVFIVVGAFRAARKEAAQKDAGTETTDRA